MVGEGIGSKRYTVGAEVFDAGTSKVYEIRIEDYVYVDAVGGLSTSKGYHIMKIDDDSFRLADAGISTNPSKVNYDRGEYVN